MARTCDICGRSILCDEREKYIFESFIHENIDNEIDDICDICFENIKNVIQNYIDTCEWAGDE